MREPKILCVPKIPYVRAYDGSNNKFHYASKTTWVRLFVSECTKILQSGFFFENHDSDSFLSFLAALHVAKK